MFCIDKWARLGLVSKTLLNIVLLDLEMAFPLVRNQFCVFTWNEMLEELELEQNRAALVLLFCSCILQFRLQYIKKLW